MDLLMIFFLPVNAVNFLLMPSPATVLFVLPQNKDQQMQLLGVLES